MVFNTTFSNISVILWWSVLLVKETGVPRENHRPAASHWQTLSHNVVHLALRGIEPTTSVVIGTDSIGSCKSNCCTITATTAPNDIRVNMIFQTPTHFYKAKLCLLNLFPVNFYKEPHWNKLNDLYGLSWV